MDVGIAKDTPGVKETGEEKLGKGPSVLVLDGRMIPNLKLRQFVTDTADKLKLKYHLASMDRGATDGSQIHVQRIGVPTVVIGAPIRYIHSHNSIMYRPDYDASVKLVTELVKNLDKKRVDSFTQG
jgi:endoglucanase